MSLSVKTKSVIATTNIAESAIDPYPDRTVNATLTTSASTVLRLVGVGNTSNDMNKLFEWEYGDTLYGTHAKAHTGMKNYINDIESAYGKQRDYKDYYIDTTKEIGPQLKKQ